MFTVWSCSNDQEVLTNAETPVEPTYNKTLADLEAYNEVMLGKVSTRVKPGEGVTVKDIRNGLKVAKADISGASKGIKVGRSIIITVGALTGGVHGASIAAAVCGSVFGAAASLKAYQKHFGKIRKTRAIPPGIIADSTFLQISEKMYIDNIAANGTYYAYNVVSEKIEIPKRFEYLKDVGESHNALVSTAIEVGNNEDIDLSLEHFKGLIPPIYITDKELEKLFSNDIFKTEYEKLLQDIDTSTDDNGFNVETFLSLNSDIPYCVKKTLDEYSDLLESYPTNLDDIVEITNGYINIIEQNNEFTEEEKEMVYSALTVSLYSPQLWCPFVEE